MSWCQWTILSRADSRTLASGWRALRLGRGGNRQDDNGSGWIRQRRRPGTRALFGAMVCGFYMNLDHVWGGDVMVTTRMNERNHEMVGRRVAQDQSGLELAPPGEVAGMKCVLARHRVALFRGVVRRRDTSEKWHPAQL